MKKILIIAYPPLDKDPRPIKQIEWLSNGYIVHTLGTKKNGKEQKYFHLKKLSWQEELIRIPLLIFGFFKLFYWDKYKKEILRKDFLYDYDLIIVHEVRLLPLALKKFKTSKILLDAHEYSPENFSDQFLWRITYGRYYKWLCKNFLDKIDIITTVSNGIKELYEKNFNVKVEVIINSAKYFPNLKPSPIDPEHIKIIYHGNASPSRNLELMIEAAKDFKKNYHLYLMLVYSKSSRHYYNKLRKKAAKLNNVHFIAPVEYKDIIEFSNSYDIGIQFHPPVNTNLRFGLGNKFFEFIQSRLAIIIGPAPEMVRYIKKYKLGVIVKDFEPSTLAKAVNNLKVTDIEKYKYQSHYYSRKLSQINEQKKFINLVERILT